MVADGLTYARPPSSAFTIRYQQQQEQEQEQEQEQQEQQEQDQEHQHQRVSLDPFADHLPVGWQNDFIPTAAAAVTSMEEYEASLVSCLYSLPDELQLIALQANSLAQEVDRCMIDYHQRRRAVHAVSPPHMRVPASSSSPPPP